jgi:5'-deoxynucleotidase YfbR-like HD superfamily hydrolase
MLASSISRENNIAQEVQNLLWDLKGVTIPGPGRCDGRGQNFTEALRELPRSGNLVRIVHYGLDLPVQSHYDHVLAVAAIADMAASRPLEVSEKKLLACCVAFHDLPELLAGDPPDYTPDHLAIKGDRARPSISFEDAVKIISATLPQPLKQHFDTTCRFLNEGIGELYELFKFADKIEPILAIWRYIGLHRERIVIGTFLEAMTDFFENPKVVSHCHSDEQRHVVRILQ